MDFEEVANEYMPMNVINGRINVNGDNNLRYKSEKPQPNCSFIGNAVGHQLSRNPLIDLFFSNKNIDALHIGMRNMVYKQTDGRYIIERQSDTELKIVMRSIFLEYARWKPDVDVVVQVRQLNQYVLDFCVKRIISSLNMKQKYLDDIAKLPVPLERAQIMSTKGTKVLELKDF
jgi:hypothetical protein